jgi:hypothetical protein
VVIYSPKKRVGAKYQGIKRPFATMVLDIIENKEGWRMM